MIRTISVSPYIKNIILINFSFIIALVPLHKLLQPRLNTRIRSETKIIDQFAYISVSPVHIARLHWQKLLLRLQSKLFLQHLNKVHQLHGAIVSDIIYFESVTFFAAQWRIIQNPSDSFSNIIYISKISI